MAAVKGGSLLIRLLLVFAVMPAGTFAGPSKRFRGRGSASELSDRTVTTKELEATLRASLDAVLRGGDDPIAQRMAKIEASMWQTFQALPKNEVGRLAPRAVRYIVHNYFAKEHGWIINGLEPDTMQPDVSELHEVSILQDKAPSFVEGLLEARRSRHGLSLDDVVVMCAALERLIFDESIALLEAAYTLNGQDSGDKVDEGTLHEILSSYLVIFEMGIKGNISDIERHHLIKNRMALKGTTWPTLIEFEQDAVMNFHYRSQAQMNPFVTRQYSFHAASRIVEDLAQGYGKWQNTECRQMKEHLMDLDPDGSGRVPLDAFYSQPETAEYQFTESLEYLRQIGALEEPSQGSAKVRIANYVAGPSNCIASSTYYSVCCLSDCESLRNEVEGQVQAPLASPSHVIAVVSNLSSSSVDAPRNLPQAMQEKLQAIADRHSGEVPLHGRLFAQWMHYAFPNECPYPHISEDTSVLTPSKWLDKKAIASAEEKRQHVEASSRAEATSEPVLSQWSDEEIVHLHETPRREGESWIGAIVRTLMQLAMLVAVLRSGLALVGSRWTAPKSKTGLSLPLRI